MALSPKVLTYGTNGVPTEVQSKQVGGGASADALVGLNDSGLIDASFFPAGIGQDQITGLPASEAIAAGALVNIYNNGGVATIRNASGAAGSFKPAHGFTQAAIASAATTGVILRAGQNTSVTGKTPGNQQWLSVTTAGAMQDTAPASGSGYLSQIVGQALSATDVDVLLGQPIQLL